MKYLLFRSVTAMLLTTLLISCSPERRLARLIKKHPELVAHDTIYKSDTTIVNGVQHDTIFRTQITKDTVIIRDKQLTIKYYNDGKTTYLKGVCDTIRIIKEVPIMVNSVNPIRYITEPTKWWQWVLYVIAVLALLFVALDVWSTFRK